MESTYIREFLAFVEDMNYSRAAKRLFISGNALTAHISKLEEELGVKLVAHGPRGLILTPAGQAFIRRADKVLHAIDELTEACNAAERSITVRLVGQLLPRPMQTLYQAIKQFEEQTGIPVSIAISDQSTTSLSELLARPQADATFWIRPRNINDDPLGSFPEGTQGTLVETERLLLGIPRDNPLFSKEVVHVADLEGQEFAFTADPGYQEGVGIIADALKRKGVTITASAAQGSTIFEYLYGSLPNRISWWNDSTIELGSLRSIPDFQFTSVEDLDVVYDIYFVYRSDRPHLADIATLIHQLAL